jgi:hypothetical protein
MSPWKTAMAQAKLQSLDGITTSDGTQITATWKLPIDSTYTRVVYLLKNNGALN